MTSENNTLLQNPSENQAQLPPQAVHAPEQTDTEQDPYAAITLPENSTLPAETLAAFKQAAAEVKLPADALGKWLALEENHRAQTAQQQAQQELDRLEKWAHQTQDEWGETWQEEVSKAVRAADAFGGPELRQLLEETGLGNHPVIVRTFHAVAQCMSEDITPGGVPSAQTDKTFTQALYGKN